MNGLEIFGLMLSSSVIASLITKGFDVWINNNKFKKEYYSLIISKRLEAYDSLNLLCSNLSQLVRLNNNDFIPFILNSFDNYQQFLGLYLDIKKMSTWYSINIEKQLIMLNEVLINFDTRIKNGEELEELAKEYLQEIREIRESLVKLIVKDFKNLHKVDVFLDDQEKNNEMIPINLQKDII